MSWGTCYSGSNNIHFDSPPIMNDGRNYSKWQPAAILNNEIRKSENIQTNWQYRNYLVNNAEKIIKHNQQEACDECCSCPAKYSDQSLTPIEVRQLNNSSNTPFLYSSCSDKSTPYGYETSNLKNIYLQDHELQARMIAPVLTQDQYLAQNYKNAN